MEPRNPAYLLTLGRYYQKYGNQQKALAAIEKAARLAPDLPEIPYSFAVSYFIADQFEEASKYVERALEIDPKFDRALFLLGISRFAMGKFSEAETLLNRKKLRHSIPSTPCHTTNWDDSWPVAKGFARQDLNWNRRSPSSRI